MASIGHVAVGLACARLYRGRLKKLDMLLFSALALLPDADVVAFSFGIPYASQWGHRGATHSLAFAFVCGVLAWALTRRFRACFWVWVAVVSHPLLDALTDGGKGVALYWPLMNDRIFFPWRPLPVAPIGLGMGSWRGAYVMAVEFVWFLPFWALMLLKPSRPLGATSSSQREP